MPTTSRGYRYPAATAAPNVPLDLANLAADVNTDVAAIVAGLTVWQTYTPVLYTNSSTSRSSIAKTVVNAQYLKLGNICYFAVEVTAGATSTNGVSVSLPVTASERWLDVGNLMLVGASSPSTQAGIAYMNAALDAIICVSLTGGFLDCTSGQAVRAHGFYKV